MVNVSAPGCAGRMLFPGRSMTTSVPDPARLRLAGASTGHNAFIHNGLSNVAEWT
jgi:hypothetical protein